MLDELTIYNLVAKYPNTLDLVRTVDRMVRADAINEFVAFANEMPIVEDADGYVRPMWLEEMVEQLKEKNMINMIDELTIYNLSIQSPNTVDLVREIEKMVRADAIDECFATMKEHSNPLWHDWLDKIAEQMKEKNE